MDLQKNGLKSAILNVLFRLCFRGRLLGCTRDSPSLTDKTWNLLNQQEIYLERKKTET